MSGGLGFDLPPWAVERIAERAADPVAERLGTFAAMDCDDAEEARDLLRHKNSNVTRAVYRAHFGDKRREALDVWFIAVFPASSSSPDNAPETEASPSSMRPRSPICSRAAVIEFFHVAPQRRLGSGQSLATQRPTAVTDLQQRVLDGLRSGGRVTPWNESMLADPQ